MRKSFCFLLLILSIVALSFVSCGGEHDESSNPVYYTVTINALTSTSEQVLRGNKVTKPQDPSKPGHDFLGWYVGDNAYDFNKEVHSNLTIDAKWYQHQKEVTFVDASMSPVNVGYGDKLTKPADPTKYGYDFVGWYIGQTEYDFDTPVTEELTLTAKWKIAVYTVTFVGTTTTEKQVNHGQTVEQPADPSKPGHDFLGWYNGSSEYDFESEVTSNLTITSKWYQHQLTVTFNEASTTPVNVGYGNKLTKPNDPSKTGKDFVGWYIGDSEYDFDSLVTTDLTLTAKWKTSVYKVSYVNTMPSDLINGSVPTGGSYEYNTSVTIGSSTLSAKDSNNSLLGWNTAKDGSGTMYDNNSSYSITSNLTLYSIWKYDVIKTPFTVKSSYTNATTLTGDNLYLNPLWLINGDNKTFNKDICYFASIIAADPYETIAVILDDLESPSKSRSDEEGIFKALGFKSVKYTHDVGSTESYDTNDISGLIMGYKEYSDDYFVILNVQSTNGSLKQWTSNFDVGADSQNYYSLSSIGSTHPRWTNKSDHKGFSISASRIKEAADNYINTNCTNANKDVVLLITGHSRGAGVANIVGKLFEDDSSTSGIKCFTYTFGTPNTTTDGGNYKTVFNIVNEDDLITYVPMNTGFTKYGTTTTVKPSSFTAQGFYPTLVNSTYVLSNVTNWINLVGAVSPAREEIFVSKKLSSNISLPSYITQRSNLKDFYKSTSIIGKKYMTDYMPALAYYLAPYLLVETPSTTEIVSLLAFVKSLGNPYTDLLDAYTNKTINTDGVAYSHEALTYVVIGKYLSKQ